MATFDGSAVKVKRHRAAQLPVLTALTVLALTLPLVPAQAQPAFTVSSTDVNAAAPVGPAQVFNRGTCSGGNRSPQLSWSHPPPGTQAYAVTMFDPDAPGHGWWHWAVTGIPAGVSSLPANASASGLLQRLGAREARNDFGSAGYGGPCPPPGKPHRYVITVYALGQSETHVSADQPAPDFEREIERLALGAARLTVSYGR
jgi:Raf kinase inhibitor-like YbhB/YbcL family protein